jgi:hypothetical protein
MPKPRARRVRTTPGGTVLPRSADGRSLAARRVKQVTIALETELSGAELTPMVHAKIGAAVVLSLAAEKLQGDLAQGKPVDPKQALELAAGLERLLADLERAKKPRAMVVA